MCFRRIVIIGAAGLFCAALASVVSCTVLEKRSECPCFLSVYMSGEEDFGCESVTLNVRGDGYETSLALPREDFEAPVVLKVPRTGVNINVFDSELDDCSGSGGLRIPVGQQCPAVYMFSSLCDTSEDEAEEYVTLKKNYCGVSLSFVSEDPEMYRMSVEGRVCGYDAEGQPLEGEFGYDPEFDGASRCFFRLPRQKDQSLFLKITGRSGGARRLSLGSYIAASGYDWTKENLDDIVVSIDYAGLELKISVNDWTTVVEDDIVI